MYQIIKFLDEYLHKNNRSSIGAVEANELLSKSGILKDSSSRPGKPLRDILRKGGIPHAYQLGNRQWVILSSKRATRHLPHYKTKTQSIEKPITSTKQNLRLTLDQIVKFQGQVSISTLYHDTSIVPNTIGVYVILHPSTRMPVFLEEGTGGRFKGRNPNVSQNELDKNWVKGTNILYIGKAGSPGGSATLRSRLKQYMQFGQGKPIGHWGGRYIWQIKNVGQLMVCWLPTPDADPREIEKDLIQQFIEKYGQRPFANLTG